MSRKSSRQKREKQKYNVDYLEGESVVIELPPPHQNLQQHKPSRKYPSQHSINRVEALNQSQGHFMAGIKTSTLTFGLGPAGTGKSFCTAAMAAEALMKGQIDRIVFTRPAVETGNSMGFLPGRLDEKFDPYFSAFKSCLITIMGKGIVECAVKNGNIIVEPLSYMRGKTFNRCFVVLDEAQNCTPEEMKMFMTRIGQETTVVVNGDLSQSDISSCSGLDDAINRVHEVPGVFIHEFGCDDIVRSGIVKDILMTYESPSVRFHAN
jgi:phosphate starvation-inducible PhoH-like protein